MKKYFHIGLVGLLFILGSQKIHPTRTSDFYQYWIVGPAVSSMDIINVYSPSDRARIGREFQKKAQESGSSNMIQCSQYWPFPELAGTPFLYAFFYSISSGNFHFDARFFSLISFALYLIGIFLICDLLRYSSWMYVLCAVFLTVFFHPFQVDVEFGNVNQLQFGIIFVCLYWQNKKPGLATYLMSGTLLGSLFLLKPNFIHLYALLFIGWLFTKQFRRLWCVLTGFAVGCLFDIAYSAFLFGEKCSWLQWWETYPSIVYLNRYLMRSFSFFLLNTLNLSTYKIFGAIFIFCTGFVLWIRRSRYFRQVNVTSDGKGVNPILDIQWAAIGSAVFLIVSPLVHRHYFIFIIPLLLISFYHSPYKVNFPTVKDVLRMCVAIISILPIAFHQLVGKLGIQSDERIWYYVGVLILMGLDFSRKETRAEFL